MCLPPETRQRRLGRQPASAACHQRPGAAWAASQPAPSASKAKQRRVGPQPAGRESDVGRAVVQKPSTATRDAPKARAAARGRRVAIARFGSLPLPHGAAAADSFLQQAKLFALQGARDRISWLCQARPLGSWFEKAYRCVNSLSRYAVRTVFTLVAGAIMGATRTITAFCTPPKSRSHRFDGKNEHHGRKKRSRG